MIEYDPDKYKRRFEELFVENRFMLERMAYRIVGNHEDAEDALQTAFMKLMERPWPVELLQNPVGYLVQATRNASTDAVRMRARRLLTEVIFDVEIPVEKDSYLEDRIEGMRLALAKMKPKFVDTLDLCCMEGLTCKRVAEIRRKKFGTVAADLFRAKFEVRRLIRLQEKKDEAQKKRQRISGSDLANPSTT